MNFLLEIGTEEIPHWMIPGALIQLAAMDLFGATAASRRHRLAAWWFVPPMACRSARQIKNKS